MKQSIFHNRLAPLVLAIALTPLLALTSPSPLRADQDLDDFINQSLEDAHLPGLSAALFQGDELLWSGSYGLSRVRQEVPIEDDTAFMLASISKTFIATAALIAVENENLDLDLPVETYLPFEVINPNDPAGVLTTRHLLTHTSGIRDNWNVLNRLYVRGDSPIALGEFMEGYLVAGGQWYNANLNYLPWGVEEGYAYSNVAASLAAYVVEVATGVPFDDYCERHIFEPLGMETAGWHMADHQARDVAMPYS